MIKLENYEVMGWEHAVRGMRNPMNSWARSDSSFKEVTECDVMDEQDRPRKQRIYFDALNLGHRDMKLAASLAKAGPVHGKFRRMITAYVDITAPLYWWKEFDTYKVGTVANSCSTMHKIHEKEFTLDDFSHEHLIPVDSYGTIDKDLVMSVKGSDAATSWDFLGQTIWYLNYWRHKFLETKDKKYWWQMIQLLPSSYNQKRTVMLNYEVLAGIYQYRKDHKLDEWREFCKWIEELPYSEIITCEIKAPDESQAWLGTKVPGPNGIVRSKEDIERDRELREVEEDDGSN